jgi:hypothetical protein
MKLTVIKIQSSKQQRNDPFFFTTPNNFQNVNNPPKNGLKIPKGEGGLSEAENQRIVQLSQEKGQAKVYNY